MIDKICIKYTTYFEIVCIEVIGGLIYGRLLIVSIPLHFRKTLSKMYNLNGLI